jgi:uncharacterized protein (UPF0332 family)
MKDKIKWCSKQKKGIFLTTPSQNICDSYLKKANDSLSVMKMCFKVNSQQWAADTAYYARYQAIYALLQKCGIKCEIHDCSIALIQKFFLEEFGTDMLTELENAKEQRISLVYYVDRTVHSEELTRNVESAPDFVFKVHEIVSNYSKTKIEKIRNELKNIKK